MKVKDHFDLIRENIGKGKLDEAIDKLQFLSRKSPRLDDIILQKARLSDLNNLILRGGISYEDSNATRYQINKAVLDILKELEIYLSGETIQNELKSSIDAFIEKFGLEEAILTQHVERIAHSTYHCLWIDDKAGSDKIEIDLLAALDVQCEIAKDPYEAYRVLNSSEPKPSVIVLESLINLRDNEHEAIEFCEFLCRYPKFRSIPIVIRSISVQQKIKEGRSHQVIKALPINIVNNFETKNPFIIKDLVEEVLLAIAKREDKILANQALNTSGPSQIQSSTLGNDWGQLFMKEEMNRILEDWESFDVQELKSRIDDFEKIEAELAKMNRTLSETEKLYFVFRILNLDTALIFGERIRGKDNIWIYLDDLEIFLFLELELINKTLHDLSEDHRMKANFIKYLIKALGVSNILISEYLHNLYGR